MTHTAHRTGTIEDMEGDYVVLVMSARGFNDEGAAPKLAEALKILSKFNPVNMGDMKTGSVYRPGYNLKRLIKEATDTSIFHGVYTSIETVKKVLKALKEADLGMSVVVSGLFEEVKNACLEIGLSPHTVLFSLGVWGRTDLLPKEPEVTNIATMCGHAMVSNTLIRKLAKDVKRRKLSPEQAAATLAKGCTCGIFNTERAAKIIEAFADKI